MSGYYTNLESKMQTSSETKFRCALDKLHGWSYPPGFLLTKDCRLKGNGIEVEASKLGFDESKAIFEN